MRAARKRRIGCTTSRTRSTMRSRLSDGWERRSSANRITGRSGALTDTIQSRHSPIRRPAMRLGNFSVSLAVKDLLASRAFYEKLGFKMVSGDPSKNWVVLQNDTTKIGLFQGMFPKNMLTFNPGWDSNKATLSDFEDVRDLQKTLKSRGLTPDPAAMNP